MSSLETFYSSLVRTANGSLSPEAHRALATCRWESVRYQWACRSDLPETLVLERIRVENVPHVLDRLVLQYPSLDVVKLLVKRDRRLAAVYALRELKGLSASDVAEGLRCVLEGLSAPKAKRLFSRELLFPFFMSFTVNHSAELDRLALQIVEGKHAYRVIHKRTLPFVMDVLVDRLRSFGTSEHAENLLWALASKTDSDLGEYRRPIAAAIRALPDSDRRTAFLWWLDPTGEAPRSAQYLRKASFQRAQDLERERLGPLTSVESVDTLIATRGLRDLVDLNKFRAWVKEQPASSVPTATVLNWLKSVPAPRDPQLVTKLIVISDDKKAFWDARQCTVTPPPPSVFFSSLIPLSELGFMPVSTVLRYADAPRLFELVVRQGPDAISVFDTLAESFMGTLSELLVALGEFSA